MDTLPESHALWVKREDGVLVNIENGARILIASVGAFCRLRFVLGSTVALIAERRVENNDPEGLARSMAELNAILDRIADALGPRLIRLSDGAINTPEIEPVPTKKQGHVV